MKFKKKKKGSMGYFYSLSPGDPKLNAEIFNNNMGSNSNTSNSEACGESLNEKFTSIIPSLKDLENNSYTFITKETYIQGDWVPLRVVLSNYYTNKDAVKIDIYRVDDNRKINSYIGSYDFIVDKLKEFDIYEKPNKNESLKEAQKKNEYEVTYIDRDTDSVTKGFVDAYSTKQAALVLKKQSKNVYKILSIECVEDHSKDDGEQLSFI